jgi:integrase
MASHCEPDNLVFGTSTGREGCRGNVRQRILVRAIERVNANIAKDGGEPLPTVSPHALRRSYASWLLGVEPDVAYVMAQLGHTDPKMTLGLYAKALSTKPRRSDRALSGAGDDTLATEPRDEVRS